MLFFAVLLDAVAFIVPTLLKIDISTGQKGDCSPVTLSNLLSQTKHKLYLGVPRPEPLGWSALPLQ